MSTGSFSDWGDTSGDQLSPEDFDLEVSGLNPVKPQPTLGEVVGDMGQDHDIDPWGVVVLGQDDPETLLRWVYQNLGLDHEGGVDEDWVQALHRGAMNSTPDKTDPEFYYCLQLCRYPVAVDEFLYGEHYLNKGVDDIYPEVLVELRKINNPNGLRVVNPYTEGLFTGGIGSAKSTSAIYTVAYQLYVLSCFDDPHATFGLDPSSEILFVFLGMAGGTALADYRRFYSMVSQSRYFKTDFPYNQRKTSELDFPHRIQVVEGINTIGQNVMGGMMDEVNFGQIVQNSRQSVDGTGDYNQTLTVYNGLARRRKSRFLAGGRAPGILCLVSSKRYPGEFTDIKLEEALSDPSIYVYDKRVWDMKPKGSFSSTMFKVFKGDVARKACIVDATFKMEKGDDEAIIEVPMDFLKEFKDDMVGSLRDIAGVSTLAKYPFFHNVGAISASFGKVKSILNLEESDLIGTQVSFNPKDFRNLKNSRWVHIDLGVTSDSAGIACGYVPNFIETLDGVGPMPVIEFDFVLRVKPPRNGEILFHKLRSLVTLLRDHGLPIKWVSFDSFQSVDSIQILRQIGFATGRQSMDITADPYSVLKTAIYSGRVSAPTHSRSQMELVSLEKHSKTGKIDHPANGCFVGSTQVETSKLQGVTFEQLAADHAVGIQHWVPTWDEEVGDFRYSIAMRPRITKYTTELVDVELENGTVIRCTPDHRFLLVDGTYKAAEDLSTSDELRS